MQQIPEMPSHEELMMSAMADENATATKRIAELRARLTVALAENDYLRRRVEELSPPESSEGDEPKGTVSSIPKKKAASRPTSGN